MICLLVYLKTFRSDINKAVPVPTFAAWNMDIRAFLKVRKSKHIGHKPLLLAVSAGNSQYVLSPVISAQQKMPEILISIYDKTVVAKAAILFT